MANNHLLDGDLVDLWRREWNTSLKKFSAGSVQLYRARNTDVLINILNNSIVELYLDGYKDRTNPILVTSNELLIQLFMMNKNKYDKIVKSKDAVFSNGKYTNPSCNSDDYIVTKSVSSGNKIYINTKKYHLTGIGILIPNEYFKETLEEENVNKFKINAYSVRNIK